MGDGTVNRAATWQLMLRWGELKKSDTGAGDDNSII